MNHINLQVCGKNTCILVSIGWYNCQVYIFLNFLPFPATYSSLDMDITYFSYPRLSEAGRSEREWKMSLLDLIGEQLRNYVNLDLDSATKQYTKIISHNSNHNHELLVFHYKNCLYSIIRN